MCTFPILFNVIVTNKNETKKLQLLRIFNKEKWLPYAS